MNSKSIIAILVGSIAAFLLGWLVWGMLLAEYYKNNMIEYPGMMIDPPILWAIFIANVAGTALLVWLFGKMGVNNMMSGFTNGAIIYFFISLSYAFMFYSMMNWYANTTVMVVDIIVNALFGGIIGGIVGMLMGKGAESKAA
jgi:hypothetical protein